MIHLRDDLTWHPFLQHCRTNIQRENYIGNIMNVYYFEIETQHASPTVVAIFAENAGRASTISGQLMLNMDHYEPRYTGAGLALFRQSGRPDQLFDALAGATIEGVAGYSIEDGWTVLPVTAPEEDGSSGL